MNIGIDLSGRVALVTGASRGIGRSIAVTLARAGASVAALATSVESAGAVVSEIQDGGGKALALGADVSDYAAADECVKQVVGEFSGLDILVNNAGITRDGLLMRMSEEDFDRVLSVNLKGTFNFIRAAARPLSKSKAGRVINISSIVGITGNAGQANYAAAKSGIFGLTKSVAKELSGRGVTCNALAPGFITTDMTADLPEAIRDSSLSTIPLGRFGAPEDLAGACLFLASDMASYVTGQVLAVDGGMAI